MLSPIPKAVFVYHTYHACHMVLFSTIRFQGFMLTPNPKLVSEPGLELGEEERHLLTHSDLIDLVKDLSLSKWKTED